MQMRSSILAVLLLLPPAAAEAAASDVRVPMVTPAGENLTLEGRLYQHDDGRRRPAVVLTHGSPRNPGTRRNPFYGAFEQQAEWFRGQGFVVLTLKRRGYGTSEGRFVELSGKCETRDHGVDGLTSANDIKAGVEYLRGLPSVDRARIVLVGQSAGGWGSLAQASRQPEGVVAVVNFAGGRGSSADGVNCNADGLVDAAGRFGRTTAVPSIWLYAENDLFFPPALSRRMHAAYAGASKSTTCYVALPPYGRDGHATFAAEDAGANWQPAVRAFLTELADGTPCATASR